MSDTTTTTDVEAIDLPCHDTTTTEVAEPDATELPPGVRVLPTFTTEELAKFQVWLEDKAVRAARKHGYCSETNNVLSEVFPNPVDGDVYRDSDGTDVAGNEWTDEDGYNRAGFNALGWDREGYNQGGFNSDGFNREGNDTEGIHKDSPERYRYDSRGYDMDGYNARGMNQRNLTREQNAEAHRYAYDRNGRDKDGFNADGYNREGLSRRQVEREADRRRLAADTSSPLRRSDVRF